MGARAQVQNAVVADMASVQYRVIGVELALKGAFKEEIAALDVRLDSIDEKLGMVATVEDAAAVRASADAHAAATGARVEELFKRATAAADQAASKLSSVEAREQAVGTREAAVQSRASMLDSREKSIADAQNSKDAELREREAALSKNEADVLARKKQLATDISAFNQRLEALKA